MLQSLIFKIIDFICWLLGHKYVVLKEFTPSQRKVGCPRCKNTWAMHDGLKAFVEWDGEFEEMYQRGWY